MKSNKNKKKRCLKKTLKVQIKVCYKEYLKPVKSMKVLSSRNAISQIFDAMSLERRRTVNLMKKLCANPLFIWFPDLKTENRYRLLQ